MTVQRVQETFIKQTNWKFTLRLVCLGLYYILGISNITIAQNSAFEFWPETDIWYRLNPAWRLSSFISITKYHESNFRDLNIYLQADYAWGHTRHPFYARLRNESRAQKMQAWMVRGGFMEGWSLGENAGAYTEDMLFAEIHKRIPLLEKVMFSQRIRVDFRWVGDDPDFSYRLRYRIMLEKEYRAGSGSIVPYINAEVYWDSRYSTVSRVRVVGGATVSWGPKFEYEGNITYQYDEHYAAADLYALNIILHVHFEKKQAQSKTE